MLNVKSAHGYYTLAIVIILSLLSLLASRTMTVATQDVVRLSIQEQTDTEAFYAAEQVMGQALTWIQSNTPTYTNSTSIYTSSTSGFSCSDRREATTIPIAHTLQRSVRSRQ